MPAPRLPAYRGTETARGGRLPASRINEFARDPVQRSISVAAADQMLPIVYGRANVPGLLFAQGLIGTDLVVGYALCVGEIDAIEMVQINDIDASTITGVTVTNYLGTPTQGVDATLSSAIVAYNDSMRFDAGNGWRGIAYVVLRITDTADVGGWPRMRATIRGRKVYDPRTDTTVYSDNTALCTADLISDLDYGLGLTATNVADVADWCDSLLSDGTTKLSRIALVLDNPRPILPDWLDLLSSYGEFYWIHEGADIKLVRDSSVDLSATPIEREWIAGTLSVRHEDTADAPRSVDVMYTVPRTDSLPWATDSVRRELAGGAVTPTTLKMEGIFSAVEADNKALAKLNRMQSRVTISCDVPDRGITYQVGDVIRLDSPARGITELPMRVLEVGMSGPGRYRISGEMYDPNHYLGELSLLQSTQLPIGAIVLWLGGSIPDNFAEFTAANGRVIVGAGGAHAQSETGGAGWNVSFSGLTTAGGAHNPNLSTDFFTDARRDNTPDYPSEPSIAGSENGTALVGNPVHSHSYDSGSVALDPLRVRRRLIKATSVTSLPPNCAVFGVPGISTNAWSRDVSAAGRVLEAAAENGNAGSASQQVPLTTGSADDRHWHISDYVPGPDYYGGIWVPAPGPSAGEEIFIPPTPKNFTVHGGSIHGHSATLQVAVRAKRRRLALYQTTGTGNIVPGQIILWEGGVVPADWVLCDGANGTPDMRDHFVEVANVGNEGTAEGDNTVNATATTNTISHSHKGGARESNRVEKTSTHASSIAHNHVIDANVPIDPPYYALAFIMYSPGA
ncbi:MAG: hypothetical protein CMJ58_12635 [Planctomycetaceae bacterium]|nr:hypothetical protein [Planctomycetaceae bacterium]